ncbi:MAG: DUF881 domain-containing protein [Abitibacteriaceae bacterium]|nr:DUF881 domain-containing protein [Abditibacteriaceae bacterium]
MNSTPYPTKNPTPALRRESDGTVATLDQSVADRTPAKLRPRKTWLATLTGICFLFGGFVALQLRAMEQVRINHQRNVEGLAQAQQQMQVMKSRFEKEKKDRADLAAHLKVLQANLTTGTIGSKKQADLLNKQIKELQLVAGLTSLSGPGVVVTLNDNPDAAKAGNAVGAFLPGIVHDFDILSVVNELRSAKADAIAVNGTRITGYTPIRCVGPTILINWEAKAAPFRIEAVGDPTTLKSALNLPDGILDKLKKDATLGVDVKTASNLRLPPTEGVPHLRMAKAG